MKFSLREWELVLNGLVGDLAFERRNNKDPKKIEEFERLIERIKNQT